MTERDQKTSMDLAAQRSYWMNNLFGELPESTIFPDYIRPSDSTAPYNRYELIFPEGLAERVKKLANNSELSVYLILVSAAAIVLHKYTGSDEVIIGSPLYKPESNSDSRWALVPLRLTIKRDTSFKDFLINAVRDTALKAYSNQQDAFEYILGMLSIQPQKGRFPLVDVIVRHEGSHGDDRVMSLDNDITISTASSGERISGIIRYNAALFKPETIERFASHYLNVLANVVNDVGVRISDIRLLSEADEQRLLVEFNQSARDYAKNETFVELFQAQVEATPDRVAVVCGDDALTYSQLNAAANKIAHRLRLCGVSAESIVGLLSSRGHGLLAAILGVFKAGGGYLPLDPLYPASRTNLVLSQSKCSIVLVSAELQERLLKDLSGTALEATTQILVIEQILTAEGQEEDLPYESIANRLAYLIYTSGSTGIPKGAMVEQEGMLNHLRAKIDDLEITQKDSVAQTASQCFDISVWQFLAALLVGGQVDIVNDEITRDPDELLSLVRDQSVTILEIVPTLLQAALDQIAARGLATSDLGSLRWMIATGDELRPDLCRRWIELYPHIRMMNAYGPTECSDDVTHYIADRAPTPDELRVPVGTPVANTSIYILDEDLLPVPVGIFGEIFVGGVGVGRGYFGDPGKTAESFPCNPFSRVGGSRLYKTGDIARFRPDANVEFIGRKDRQVKIRGYRIETGEIESILRQCPGVKEAVVQVRSSTPGEKQLVAYIVESSDENCSRIDAREFLKHRVAEYMIPSTFVFLDSLPLNANGKLDRQALPSPEPAAHEEGRPFVPPSSRREKLLAGVWQEVFGVERVGAMDNFFDLGGDSILSIHIIAKAHQEGLKLSPRQLFDHPTIEALARVASEVSDARQDNAAVVGPVSLTPIQHWFFERDLPNPDHFNQSVSIEAERKLDPALLEQAIQSLLAHHDALRLRFEKDGDTWRQSLIDVSDVAVFQQVDLSSLPQPSIDQAIAELTAQAQASLSLTSGPLTRFVLIDFGSERPNRLLIIVHHLAVDIISWRILLEDLDRAYRRLLNNQAITLPPKTTSFQAWADLLLDYAKSEALIAELPFWMSQDHPDAVSLFSNYDGDADGQLVKGAVTKRLNIEETNKVIVELPRATRSQIIDILLTGLILAIAKCSGVRATLVDLESHGRENISEGVDLSRTVGWFASMFPILLETHDPDDAGAALKLISERMLRVQNGGIGYGVLKYLSHDPEIATQLDCLPRAEICFNYFGRTDLKTSDAQAFEVVQDSFELSTDVRNVSRYRLAITCYVADNCLYSKWHYRQSEHDEISVETLAEEYVGALRSLIETLSSSRAEYLSSDFPGAKINQEELDIFLSEIG